MNNATIKKINKYYDARPQLLKPILNRFPPYFILDVRLRYFLDFIVKENDHLKEVNQNAANAFSKTFKTTAKQEEQFEEFGQSLDTIDNLIHALILPIPNEIHIKALKESLPDLKDRLKKVYLELGGSDIWKE